MVLNCKFMSSSEDKVIAIELSYHGLGLDTDILLIEFGCFHIHLYVGVCVNYNHSTSSDIFIVGCQSKESWGFKLYNC